MFTFYAELMNSQKKYGDMKFRRFYFVMFFVLFFVVAATFPLHCSIFTKVNSLFTELIVLASFCRAIYAVVLAKSMILPKFSSNKVLFKYSLFLLFLVWIGYQIVFVKLPNIQCGEIYSGMSILAISAFIYFLIADIFYLPALFIFKRTMSKTLRK